MKSSPLTIEIDAKAVVLLAEIAQLADSLREDLSWRDEPNEIIQKALEIADKHIHVNRTKKQ